MRKASGVSREKVALAAAVSAKLSSVFATMSGSCRQRRAASKELSNLRAAGAAIHAGAGGVSHAFYAVASIRDRRDDRVLPHRETGADDGTGGGGFARRARRENEAPHGGLNRALANEVDRPFERGAIKRRSSPQQDVEPIADERD